MINKSHEPQAFHGAVFADSYGGDPA